MFKFDHLCHFSTWLWYLVTINHGISWAIISTTSGWKSMNLVCDIQGHMIDLFIMRFWKLHLINILNLYINHESRIWNYKYQDKQTFTPINQNVFPFSKSIIDIIHFKIKICFFISWKKIFFITFQEQTNRQNTSY